ncbi:MAG: putative N-acetylglucosamine kinase [Bacteroidetes bacterium]|nr:putative N-acetylglucosamine kinase [Bacteroidota bacterium]
MSRKPLVLGVDGGGTKTAGLIADLSGNILARREVGASNPNVVGFEAAAKNLHQLITKCCDDLRCQPNELQSIVLALAGAGKETNRKKIKDSLARLFENETSKALPITVETDSRAALEGAFGGGPGVVIIAGTGSIVTGKTERREVITVGGWGRILGDEGSGYYIGREALRLVTLVLDGRGGSTKLKELFARKLNWQTRDDLITAVYQDKFELSKLAPLVMEAASDHDLVSQRLLQQAASHLADQARVIVMKMGILRKVGLVMCGGLIDHETVYGNTLHLKIMKMLPQVDVRPPMHSPAHGAVLMAIERSKKG